MWLVLDISSMTLWITWTSFLMRSSFDLISFLFFSSLLLSVCISARASSVSITSRSSTGLIFPFTWVIFSFSKHLTTWTIAFTSLIFARKAFPKPSPCDAPFTSPAISTNVVEAWINCSDWEILCILSSLSSGTLTIPIFGSMVQKGKFSAAIADSVNALKSVDLPTFGRPTIPHLNPIINN